MRLSPALLRAGQDLPPGGAALDETPYWLVDTAFASLLILLTAADSGLGALFFSVADVQALRREFGVPEQIQPIGAIAIGYPLSDRPSSSLARGRLGGKPNSCTEAGR